MYRRHFLLFAGISTILAIPSAALSGLALGWFSVVLDPTTAEPDLNSFTPILTAFAAAGLISLLVVPFTYGASCWPRVSALRRRSRWGHFRSVATLFRCRLLDLVLLDAGAPPVHVAVALWLWVFVSWIAVTPAMFVENIGLRLRWDGLASVRSRWWPTF